MTEPLVQRTIGDRRLPQLLDEALDLATSNGWQLYLWVALPLAVLSAVFSVLSLQWSGALSAGDLGSLLAGCRGLAILLLLVPLSMVLSLIGYTALFEAALCRVEGRAVSAADMYAFALRPPVLVTVGLAAASVLMASVLLILPGIVLFLLLSMVIPVIHHERIVGFAALSRSIRLTLERREKELRRFHLVRVLAVFVAYIGVGYSLSLILTLPYQLVTQIALWRQVAAGQAVDPTQALDGLLWLQIPTNVVTSLVGSWVVFYSCHCLALLYQEFRARVDGIDLEAMIDSWQPAAHQDGAVAGSSPVDRVTGGSA